MDLIQPRTWGQIPHRQVQGKNQSLAPEKQKRHLKGAVSLSVRVCQGAALRQRALPHGVAQCGVDSQLWVPSLVDGVVIFRLV